MIILTPYARAGWRRTPPHTLSDLAWRSHVPSARAHGATLTDATRVSASEAERLAAALRAGGGFTIEVWRPAPSAPHG